MLPRIVAFDLDGTLWSPDMYELWGGGGAPFREKKGEEDVLLDRAGNTVRLLGVTRRVLAELHARDDCEVAYVLLR